MGKLSIEEQNEIIIRSRFPLGRPAGKSDNRIGTGVNEELVASVKEHRKEFGLSTKFQLLRNYLRTRPFIKTTMFKAA
jgi:hypothetical protein